MSFGRSSYPQPTLRSPHCIQIALFRGASKRLPWRMWSRCRRPSARSRDRWPLRLPCPGGQTLRGEASVGRPAGSRRTGEGEMCQVYILNRHGRHGLSQLLLLFSLLNGSKWSFHWKTMDRTWWIQCMAAMTLHQWRVRWFRARASSETMPQTRATWKAILYVTAWMWNKCRQHPLPWDQSRIPAAKPRVFAP